MPKLLQEPSGMDLARFGAYEHDDFCFYETAKRFTTVATDSGTVASGDAVNGILVLTPSDGTVADNDEAYLKGTNKTWKFEAAKPFIFEASIQFTEANTDDANIAVGVCSAVAANTIVDDGAGLLASFSGAVIYKVDGETVWRFITSIGTSRIVSQSTKTAGGAAYQRLRIEGRLLDDAATIEVVPYVDGVQLIDAVTGKGIKHVFSITSAAAMTELFGVKNGGANLEVLNVDYFTRLTGR